MRRSERRYREVGAEDVGYVAVDAVGESGGPFFQEGRDAFQRVGADAAGEEGAGFDAVGDHRVVGSQSAPEHLAGEGDGDGGGVVGEAAGEGVGSCEEGFGGV